MIKFGLLKIEGFRSIGNMEIDLGSGGITAIKGENGAGKSSILNALVWVIFGKTLNGSSDVVMKKVWQPKDYTGVKVEIYYDKSGTTHHIIRCSEYTGTVNGSKGKNRVIYEVDGCTSQIRGKVNTQTLIEESIEMSLKLFKNSITFGQRLKRIAQESGPDKKALFEEAFNVGYLSVAKTIANKYKQGFQREYDIFSEKVKSTESQYQEVRDTYLELKSREDNFRKLQKEEIDELIGEEKNLKEKLGSLQIKPISDKEKSLTKKYREELEKLKAKRKETQQILNEYTSEKGLLSLVDNILRLIDKNDLKKATELLMELRGYIKGDKEFYETRDTLTEKVQKLENAMYKYNHDREYEKRLKQDISKIREKIQSLKAKRNEIISPKYKKRRLEIRKSLRILRVKLNKLNKELENYTWVINDPLSNSGIKTYLFDTSMKVMNECLASYSRVIGMNIYFTVDTFAKKRDFITLIEKDGENLLYEDMSGGEEQLVDIAMAFALHQSTTVSKGINLLFLDELFENLDAENVDVVTDMIKTIASGKSVFVITHKPNFNIGNSRSINIVKENNISRIS